MNQREDAYASSAVRPVAVVTGASSGIGRAVAIALGQRGYRVALLSRDQAAMAEVTSEIAAAGSTAISYPTDLSVPEAPCAVAERIIQELDRVDVLVHSAGVILKAEVATGLVEDFDLMYRVNLRAPYLLTQALLPQLRRSQGQIVFVNSSVAHAPARARDAGYTVTKYGLRALADSVRAEVNTDGVRVLSVYPGKTATPMQARLAQSERVPYLPGRLLQPEDVASSIICALELPRTAEIMDLSIRPMLKS